MVEPPAHAVIAARYRFFSFCFGAAGAGPQNRSSVRSSTRGGAVGPDAA
jgi:hypothetical protein